MKSLLCILLAVAGLLAASPETNVTGKWTGSLVISRDGESRNSTAFLVLKQAGAEITGTVGPNEGEQYEIKSGKVEGEKITILVETDGRVVNFDLTMTGDRIAGDVKMSREGQTQTAKLDVSRSK